MRKCLLALLFAFVSAAFGADWPQWRGPFWNGSTDETDLPATWSKSEKVLWVSRMPGSGSSTPIVWGDRVFLTSLDKAKDGCLALCVDANSGRVLWSRREAPYRRFLGGNDPVTPSAVTDGKLVVFLFGTGHLVAFDLEGNALWRRNLEEEFGPLVVKYGYSSSPALFRGRLYVQIMQNKNPRAYGRKDTRKGPLDSWLLALDPATGRYLWKQKRNTDAGEEAPETYNTPMPYVYPDGRAEIIMVGGEYVTGHEAETGQELWRWEFSPHNRLVWQRTVPSAVPGDGLIYVVRPQHRPLYALKAGGKGRLDDSYIAWRYSEATPDVVTPLLYRGRLYSMNDKLRVMVCHDARTGRVVWKAKLGLGNVVRASPTGADSKVYVINRSGDVVVLEAGDTFKVLSRIRMGEPPVHSTISIAHGKLFIRTARNLYCISKKRPEEERQ